MKKFTKRAISLFLTLCMLFTFIPFSQIVFAAEVEKLKISADSLGNTVSIVYRDNASSSGDVEISDTTAGIARDYDQEIFVKVTNPTEEDVELYLTVENVYPDIYLNFVEYGSIDEPITILAGMTEDIKLTIFAQNASRTTYDFKVNAYKLENSITTLADTATISLNIDQEPFNVSITAGTQDPYTLAQTFTIRNTGTEKITDLSLRLDGDVAEYAAISPIVSNYEINPGATVVVEVAPNLSKFKSDDITEITGNLVAFSGNNSFSAAVVFDTEGQEITDITMGQLALLQDGNPFWDLEIVKDYISVTLNGGSDSIDLLDLVEKFYDPDNLAEKPGVDSIEKLDEVLSHIFDDDGMINFASTTKFDYNNGADSLFIQSSIESYIIPSTPVARVSSASTLENQIYFDKDGNLHFSTEINISSSDYYEQLTSLDEAARLINVIEWPNTIAEKVTDDPSTLIQVRVTNSILKEGLIGKDIGSLKDQLDDFFTEVWSGHTIDNINITYDPSAPASSVAGTKAYINAAKVKAGLDVLDALNTVGNALTTIDSVHKTYDIWTNPNVTLSSDKRITYTALQTAKVINTWGGSFLIGAGIGAIFDGPGIVVGIVAGVASSIIDMGLDSAIDKLEARAFDPTALHYDIYGSQCTNAGRTFIEFFLSLFGINPYMVSTLSLTSPDTFHVTSRMTSGTPFGNRPSYADNNFGGWEYQHILPVNYTYYVNGQLAGKSSNVGLTELDIIEIDMSMLREGKNTIQKHYSTNAGHYKVVSDTEITIPISADTRVAYIGTPDTMKDIRSLPDFAIYNENIIIFDKDMVESEANRVNANVYNRGSRGGWVNIIATDNNGEQFREENVYIEAFSVYPIEFDWIPELDSNTITINLENASTTSTIQDSSDPTNTAIQNKPYTIIWLQESNNNNNQASVTVDARERETPVIGTISTTGTVYANEMTTIATEITDVRDITGITYSIDGASETPVTYKISNNKINISISRLFETAGDYDIRFTVTYRNSKDTTVTVDNTETITVTPSRRATFKVAPATATGLQFYLWKIDGGAPVETAITVTPILSDRYEFILTHEIITDIDKYFLVLTGIVDNDSRMTLVPLGDAVSGLVTLNLDAPISPALVEMFTFELSEFTKSISMISENVVLNSEGTALYDTDFNGTLSIDNPTGQAYYTGSAISFKISNLVDIYGNSYYDSPYKDTTEVLSGKLILTDSLNSNIKHEIPVLSVNPNTLIFSINIPNTSAYNGNYTYSVELTQNIVSYYSITTIAGEGGSVTSSNTFKAGTTVVLTATPDEGYSFAGWYEDGERIDGASTTYSFVATEDRTLEARFIPVVSPVPNKIKITTNTLQDGVVGTKYSSNINTTGKDIIAYKITTGNLPNGLTLNNITGDISGTPTKAGKYTFTVQISDGVTTDRKELSINILSVPQKSSSISVIPIYMISKHIVIFENTGDTKITSRIIDHGEKVVQPDDPVREGYTFMGWYYDSNYIVKYNFNKRVTIDITLYAKWKKA